VSRIVYAVPGVTPQGSEIADLNQARALARAKGVHLFAYREEDDGSLTMLGSETPKGSVVKFKANPLKESRGPSFHDTLRRLGNTGHTVYRDLKTGQEEKKPKTVYFSDGEGALQALAVFLVLEGADTRGVVDISGGRDHLKQASVRFPDGRIYSATLTPERNDYWIMGEGIKRAVRWDTWANAGVYPDTKLFKKTNPMPERSHQAAYYGAKPAMRSRAAINEQMAEMSPSSSLPEMADLPQKLKVVVGPKSYSAPALTREGARAFKEMTGEKYDELKTPRHHPALVWLAENRPGYFYSYLKEPGFRLYDVPGGVYEIREYDGWESLHTPESIRWVRIPGAKSR
jgi:hypothetical protein